MQLLNRHGWFLENCYIEPNIWRQKSLPISVVRLCNVRSAVLSWKRFWRRFLWSDIRKACYLGNLAEQTEKKRDTSVRIARFVTWISTWSFWPCRRGAKGIHEWTFWCRLSHLLWKVWFPVLLKLTVSEEVNFIISRHVFTGDQLFQTDCLIRTTPFPSWANEQ